MILHRSKHKVFFAVTSLFLLIACSKSDSNGSNPTGPDKSANLKSIGASANDLLSDAKYANLHLEIVYEEGAQPTNAALNNLIDFINTYAHKSNITTSITSIPSQNKEKYTIQEVADIEAEYRTQYNEGNTIAVFIFYANGSSDKDEGSAVVLGAAFRNTSMVIYQKTIMDVANKPSLTLEEVETATLQHEFGHLFGLINLETEDIHPNHEDSENNNHCMVEDCLMNASVRFGNALLDRAKSGKKMPVLDALCIEDLQAYGGK